MRAAPDQSQALACVGDLLSRGARRGAAQVLFNAALQRRAAEVRDLSQRPVFGRRVAAPYPDPLNDNHSPASSTTA